MRNFFLIIIIIVLVLVLSAGSVLADGAFKPSYASDAQTTLATAMTVAAAALFLFACVMLAARDGAAPDSVRVWPVLLLAIVLAVALRLITAASYPGYATDLACFKGWASAAYEGGLSNFYTNGMFADYPPGYIYILYVLGFVRSVFAIDAGGALYTVIIKLPSILAEVGLALIAYRIAAKRQGKTAALFVASLLLFNPAMFFNSSVWGQIDAVFVLPIVVSLYYLKKQNGIVGAVFFTIALLIKPQAIMFAPVVGLYYIYSLFIKGGTGKAVLHLIAGAAAAAALIVLAAWPFTGSQEPFWIVGRYVGTIGQYGYASLNAFNLYALLGANWATVTDPFLMLTYETWGKIFIGLICITVIILQWRSRKTLPLYELAAFLLLGVFMLVHAMHERYIVPAGVLLIFSYIYARSRKTLFFAAAFTLTALLNEMVTLYASGVVTSEVPTIAISAVNVALFTTYAIITTKKLATRKVLIKSPAVYS